MRRRSLIVATGIAGIALTVWVSAFINSDPVVTYATPADFIRRVASGGAFLVVGCILWMRQPGNRIGPLLIVYAFAWIIGANLAPAAGEVLPYRVMLVTSAVSALYGIPLVWLIVSFPSGGLVRRIDRAAVLLVTVDVIFSGGMRVIGDCCAPRVGVFWGRYYPVSSSVVAAFVLILVAVRLRRANAVERRALVPVWIASGTLALVFFISGIQALAIALTPRQGWALATALDYTAMLIPIAYGFGLLRLRSRRAGVGKLVIELRDQPAPGKLRQALARTLGDPSVELAFWLPEKQEYVDPTGKPFSMPEHDPSRAVTVLERGGQRLAVLIYDATLMEAPELVASVGAVASLALDNERLQAAVRAQLEEVRASRQRIVEAADAERRRVERNIHDGAQQRLMTLSLALRRAQRKLDQDSRVAEAILEEAALELNLAVSELRELARGIHPSILSDEGLGPAIRALADRAAVPIRLHIDDLGSLPPSIEATAYYLVAEALTNVTRYARASLVAIEICQRSGYVSVEVRDDGVGGADASKGSGLRGLSDRVEAVGGRMSVETTPGVGTRIAAELPCG